MPVGGGVATLPDATGGAIVPALPVRGGTPGRSLFSHANALVHVQVATSTNQGRLELSVSKSHDMPGLKLKSASGYIEIRLVLVKNMRLAGD